MELTEKELSQEEISERVAILKRFRTLLEQQRNKFREYLKVLELQENKIETEDTDAILAHSQLETEIVKGIGSLQKVIVPMQELCTKTNAAFYNPKDAVPIESIQKDLNNLQKQVLEQNEKNRILLKEHMCVLKQQISNFKNPYKNTKSVFTSKLTSGSRIAIDI